MYNDDRNYMPQQPVSVGDELEVTIEGLGEKGDGIAKKDGFIIFVPNVSEGQSYKIKINKVLRKVSFADVIGDAEAPAQETTEEPAVEEVTEEAAVADETVEEEVVAEEVIPEAEPTTQEPEAIVAEEAQPEAETTEEAKEETSAEEPAPAEEKKEEQ